MQGLLCWSVPALPRSTPFPTAVFLGDSITTGWQAITHPRNRWTSLVCEHLRWREVNLADDGMGFFARRGGHLPGGGRTPSSRDTTWLETVLRAEPDVVTVSLGLNDAVLLPSQLELIQQAVEHDLSFLASRLRGVSVVVAPYFPTLGVGPRFELVRRMVHEQATTLGLVSTDAMSLAIDGDEDLLSVDGIHPNDAGHAAIARSMIRLYEDLVPALCSPAPGPSA
ncbi:SGNH/GDSL hydrolase family protein [Actinomyces respiraculi]|uniref:SGNH/GDSL hydrolase family protein n=1 Tax=Actinomyces respiraculi TaxID=2744574 RepID=A0A7T0PW42_9ACTO|nr:SGNH/GDSL hydrolase family protein [Actinomyces respiraculi]